MFSRSGGSILRAHLAACAFLTGCAPGAAPTLSLFGAYFPNWILCGLVGVVAAGATRGVFVSARLDHAIPAQLLVCTSVGVMVATLVWLWLGQ